MRLRRTLLLAVFASLVAATSFSQTAAQPKSPAAQPLVLRGGKLLTISHGTIPIGVIVIEGNRITAVGPAASVRIPANARVIDVTGMTVYPGLIDSETHLGLTEIEADQATNDLIETSDEIMPHMHVYDAFHAETELIPVTRVNGVTNAVVAPDTKDTIPGQDIFIQLDGRSANEMILTRDLAMPLNFTGDQRRKGEQRAYPSTRMGMAAQLRQAFLDALDYGRKQTEFEQKTLKDKDKAGSPPKRDLKLEALLPYLEGKKPVVLAANEPSDIETATALAREFNLKIVLNHVTRSTQLLDMIAKLNVPVIVGPIYEIPKDTERYDAVYSLPAELHKRGVKIALASYDAHNSRNLPYAAGYAVAYGLPYDDALRSITLTPAEIWGVAEQLGSLDAGKLANIVIATGDPLDVKTDVKHVFIQGHEVPLDNRQIRLRNQYGGGKPQ